MDPRKALWAVSILSGLVYFVTIPWHPFPGSIVLKGLSVSTLALAAWLEMSAVEPVRAKERNLLTGALALSSLGDILLDVSKEMFLFGLGAFLIAHLCYIQLFFAQRRRGDRLGAPRLLLSLMLLGYSFCFTWWLMPALGNMGFPVMMYVGVITAMVFSALTWRATTPWILVGAFLFLISDSVLGASKFREPLPFRGWIVWGTYYGAQFLIARGALRELVIFPHRKS